MIMELEWARIIRDELGRITGDDEFRRITGNDKLERKKISTIYIQIL
jgi:hypothetical protein